MTRDTRAMESHKSYRPSGLLLLFQISFLPSNCPQVTRLYCKTKWVEHSPRQSQLKGMGTNRVQAVQVKAVQLTALLCFA